VLFEVHGFKIRVYAWDKERVLRRVKLSRVSVLCRVLYVF